MNVYKVLEWLPIKGICIEAAILLVSFMVSHGLGF